MRKKLISICFVVILACGLYGCARTAVETLDAGTDNVESEYTEAEDSEAAMSAEEYGQSEEGIDSQESVDNQGKPDTESLDIIPMPDEIAAIEKEQRQIKKFYRIAEEDCGLSHEEAQRWFDIITEDDILDGGIREITDLLFDDIDGNGVTDMVIMVQKTENFYGEGALYFYMNEEEPYCFTDEWIPFFYWNICYADLNGDGNVEIAVALRGTGNGGAGDWHKVLFSYTGSTMERLEFPSDSDDEYEVGLEISVIMEPEPDTYTAYCPYLDESITFQARNIYEGDKQKSYLADAPKGVGYNIRGYYYLQVVTWQGKDALQVSEYLCGEGGNVHCVGEACFILIWDEQGNGSVADWWVEGNT